MHKTIKRAASRRRSSLTQASNGNLIAGLCVLAFFLLSLGFLASSQVRQTAREAKTKTTKRLGQPKKMAPVAAPVGVVPAELRKGEDVYLVQNLTLIYGSYRLEGRTLSNDERQALIKRLRINYGRITATGATWDASKATWVDAFGRIGK